MQGSVVFFFFFFPSVIFLFCFGRGELIHRCGRCRCRIEDEEE